MIGWPGCMFFVMSVQVMSCHGGHGASRHGGGHDPHVTFQGQPRIRFREPSGLRLGGISYTPADASTSYLHPGKSADVKVNGQTVGVFGELHPLVKEKYDFE